jgi:hypothetical protein
LSFLETGGFRILNFIFDVREMLPMTIKQEKRDRWKTVYPFQDG